MILKQKVFQELVQNDETKGKPRKKCHIPNSPTSKPLGYRAIDITKRYNLYSTSESDKLVPSKQQREIL